MHQRENTGESCTVDPNESYTVADVARITKSSTNSVYRLIDSGDLRSYTVGKSGKRVFGRVLLEYMGVSA